MNSPQSPFLPQEIFQSGGGGYPPLFLQKFSAIYPPSVITTLPIGTILISHYYENVQVGNSGTWFYFSVNATNTDANVIYENNMFASLSFQDLDNTPYFYYISDMKGSPLLPPYATQPGGNPDDPVAISTAFNIRNYTDPVSQDPTPRGAAPMLSYGVTSSNTASLLDLVPFLLPPLIKNIKLQLMWKGEGDYYSPIIPFTGSLVMYSAIMRGLNTE